MAELDTSDFAAFFAAANDGNHPYPWQQRLLEEAVATRCWPDHLDLPTGAGKTSVIDIAVFALALAGLDGTKPWTPRRIVMVVDRRVVVDQAARHSRALARHLADPQDEVVARTAAALRTLGGGDVPLVSVALRGGTVTDDAWTRRPDQPAVLASTVDQVGSRLLFRGYGVSPGMRPVHAGLLGADCLFVLDEVHLSQPFAQTLDGVGQYLHWVERDDGRPPWHFMTLSATPGASPGRVFSLGEADTDPTVAPRLVQTLAAPKPAHLQKVKTPADRYAGDSQFAKACGERARALARDETGLKCIAVVVNRVETARQVASLLAETGETTVLLTGRMRSLDRDQVLASHGHLFAAGRERHSDDPITFVVATQSIEAGADFDFDAIVTECAALDSLRQRAGRVNRRGELGSTGRTAQVAVLVRSSDLAAKAIDPVYGEALRETWDWLESQGEVDFGIDRLTLPPAADLDALVSPKADAPALLPRHLDLVVQTRPAPAVEPDISLFLHGPTRVETDVNLVWRADVTRGLFERAADDQEAMGALIGVLSACPPAPVEAVTVPIGAVRAWLTDSDPVLVYDVEGAPSEPEPRRDAGLTVLRWAGDDTALVHGSALRPGDTVVLPASEGGLGRGTWDASATGAVTDLGDLAQAVQRGRAVLRLHPDLWAEAGVPPPRPPDEDVDPIDPYTTILDWLRQDAVSDSMIDGSEAVLRHVEHALGSGRRGAAVLTLPAFDASGSVTGEYWVVQAREPLPRLDETGGNFDPEASAFTAVEVGLDDHLRGVGDWAGQFARHCGLPDDLVSDLELAGRLHDLGKADPRFQLMLHAGDPVTAAMAGRPLAKSAIPSVDRESRMRAASLAGYPRGSRHELVSLALVDDVDEIAAEAGDWDLVRHLVASHHGWCRPFAPVVRDPRPVQVTAQWRGLGLNACSAHGLDRLDSAVAPRFWSLVRRYGWHGLAWLESLLRLADHRRSEEETRGRT